MSKSDVWENDLLGLIFTNVAIASIGDAGGLRASVAAGSLWLSLHTADPAEGGTAVSSETAYAGYSRKIRARATGAGGFTVTGSSVSPFENVDFDECTASPGGPLTHFGVVNTASGAGKLLYSGPLSPSITVAVGVVPRIKSTSSITED